MQFINFNCRRHRCAGGWVCVAIRPSIAARYHKKRREHQQCYGAKFGYVHDVFLVWYPSNTMSLRQASDRRLRILGELFPLPPSVGDDQHHQRHPEGDEIASVDRQHGEPHPSSLIHYYS